MEINKVQLQEAGSYLVNGTMGIPAVTGNTHYQEVQEWIAQGNPVIPLRPSAAHVLNEQDEWVEDVALRQELLKDAVESAVQAMHNEEARARGYDDINSIGKYTGYENVFQAECIALGQWVAACWAKCYELLDAGVEMTVEEALAQMPTIGV